MSGRGSGRRNLLEPGEGSKHESRVLKQFWSHTVITSLRACKAVPELSPGCLSASSKVGIVLSMASLPRCSCKPSNARAAAVRTFAASSTREVRTMDVISSSYVSLCVSVALCLEVIEIHKWQ